MEDHTRSRRKAQQQLSLAGKVILTHARFRRTSKQDNEIGRGREIVCGLHGVWTAHTFLLATFFAWALGAAEAVILV